MLYSSGLGFVKIFSLARILDAASFGYYISLFGASAFLASLSSFGSTEGTLKEFPRLLAENKTTLVIERARAIFKVLTARFVLLTIATIIIPSLWDLPYKALDLLPVALLGWTSALTLLFASIIRASDSLQQQKRFYANRAILSIILSLGCGLIWGWRGALWGECVASILGLVYSTALCRSLGINFLQRVGASIADATTGAGGRRLYLAFILSSSMTQLDKLLISHAAGAAQAGVYGVVSIIYQIAGLLVNIVTQRVGTRFIILNQGHEPVSRQLQELGKWALGFFIFNIGLVTFLLLAKDLSLATPFVERYGITAEMIVYAGLISCLQIFSLLEFFLIAHDQEKDVALGSSLGFLVFIGCFAYGSLLGVAVETYFQVVLLSKLVQVLVLASSIVRVAGRRIEVAR